MIPDQSDHIRCCYPSCTGMSLKMRIALKEKLAENRGRATKFAWSSSLVKKKTSGWFDLTKSIVYVMEIVPATIAIFLGIWLIGATTYNSKLPMSEQLRYKLPLWLHPDENGFNSSCDPDTMVTIDNKTRYCFQSHPVTKIPTGIFQGVGAAMIATNVERLHQFISFWKMNPVPNTEIVMLRSFLRWYVATTGVLFADDCAIYLMNQMSYNHEYGPHFHNFTFTNDPSNQFYYLCRFVVLYMIQNLLTSLTPKLFMAWANIYSKSKMIKNNA